jgi:hypothetical protein
MPPVGCCTQIDGRVEHGESNMEFRELPENSLTLTSVAQYRSIVYNYWVNKTNRRGIYEASIITKILGALYPRRPIAY